jgi:hypothetical protein
LEQWLLGFGNAELQDVGRGPLGGSKRSHASSIPFITYSRIVQETLRTTTKLILVKLLAQSGSRRGRQRLHLSGNGWWRPQARRSDMPASTEIVDPTRLGWD